MAEPVEAWWRRRQFSRGVEVPYPIGTYREAWASYPTLIRQYHPDLNAGITLTQIPPAAEVLLLWQCEVGHLFAATPNEQRSRPQRERRRSSWCPECLRLAKPRTPRGALGSPLAPGIPSHERRPARLCPKTPDVAVGDSFTSDCAPRPASAVEAELRAALHGRLEFTAGVTAIRVGRPFFAHLEVWPDIVIPELRIAVEYDSTGRHGLEHVGRKQAADERKDRATRQAHWEVVRIRTGKLPKLGPHDLQLGSIGATTVGRLLDEFRAIRGALIVDAYSR